MTLASRGGSPSSSASSAAVLILCLYRLPSDSITRLQPPPRSTRPAEIPKPSLGRHCNRFRIPQWRLPPEFDIEHHSADPFFERYGWFPTNVLSNLGGICPSGVGLARSLWHIYY